MDTYQSQALSHSREKTDESSSNLLDFSWLDTLLPLPIPSINPDPDNQPTLSSIDVLPQSYSLSLPSNTKDTSTATETLPTVRIPHATHSSPRPRTHAEGDTQSVPLVQNEQMLVMLRFIEDEPIVGDGRLKAKEHWMSQDTTLCCRKLTVEEVEYLGLIPVVDDVGRRTGHQYYTNSGPFEVSAPTPNEIAALRQELQDAHSTIERMTAALLLLGMPPEDIVQLTTNFEDTVSPK
nr:uncharacterized protein I203_00107 [Kwoniella mangroviensis CBS 8507]OCF69980.1 hypothetical protein I203_00107 [Kwoniella mangroviensis CBS 8507]